MNYEKWHFQRWILLNKKKLVGGYEGVRERDNGVECGWRCGCWDEVNIGFIAKTSRHIFFPSGHLLNTSFMVTSFLKSKRNFLIFLTSFPLIAHFCLIFCALFVLWDSRSSPPADYLPLANDVGTVSGTCPDRGLTSHRPFVVMELTSRRHFPISVPLTLWLAICPVIVVSWRPWQSVES